MSLLPDAVLFDMDGTLVDSEQLYRKVWQETAREQGIELNRDTHRQACVGFDRTQGLEQIIRLTKTAFDRNRFYADLIKHELRLGQQPTPLRHGALGLLDWLASRNVTIALVTSSSRAGVERHFHKHGGVERFTVAVSADDVCFLKPNPEPYQKACELLGLDPGRTVAVEDSVPGAESALSAGCRTLMVPDHAPPAHIQEQVWAVCDSLVEVQHILCKGLSSPP